jgi:hypothetical protein
MPGAMLIRQTDPPAPIRANPEREYMAGGVAAFGGGVFTTLANHAREVAGLHGDDLYDAMLLDSTVSASVDTIKAAILAEGIQFIPAVTYEDVDNDDATEADADLAYEINEAWMRSVEALNEPFEDFCWQMLDGIPKGCMLGEQTYRFHEEGPDAGRWMLDRAAAKSRYAWNFEVDSRGRVVGFSGWEARPRYRGGRVLPREKFVLFSWLPRNGDPRGTPALDSVIEPWNLKTLLRPQYWKYLDRFAVPSLFGTTAEDAGDVEETDDEGNLTGATISAQQAMLNAIVRLQNGTAVVGAYGSTLTPLNPSGDGSAFGVAFDFFDRQIATGILHSARAILEAQRSSRKDAETSQDTLGAIARVGKKSLGATIRSDMIRPWVKMNWGEDAARRFTPVAVLGLTEQQDFSRNANAVAKLASVGLIGPEEKPGALRFLGIGGLVKRIRASITPPARGTNVQDGGTQRGQ